MLTNTNFMFIYDMNCICILLNLIFVHYKLCDVFMKNLIYIFGEYAYILNEFEVCRVFWAIR